METGDVSTGRKVFMGGRGGRVADGRGRRRGAAARVVRRILRVLGMTLNPRDVLLHCSRGALARPGASMVPIEASRPVARACACETADQRARGTPWSA